MKKSVFLEMILETVIFIVILTVLFVNLGRPVSQNTIIIIGSLTVVTSILIFLSGHYFRASVFNANVIGILPLFFLFHGSGVFFLVALVLFLIFFFISITEKNRLKVLIYRDANSILSLAVSFALVFASALLLNFFF